MVNDVVEAKYCIQMENGPRRKKDEILSLVMKTDYEPIAIDSLEKALKTAEAYKQWHPEITFVVRKYFGRSIRLMDFWANGSWKVGEEEEARF